MPWERHRPAPHDTPNATKRPQALLKWVTTAGRLAAAGPDFGFQQSLVHVHVQFAAELVTEFVFFQGSDRMMSTSGLRLAKNGRSAASESFRIELLVGNTQTPGRIQKVEPPIQQSWWWWSQ